MSEDLDDEALAALPAEVRASIVYETPFRITAKSTLAKWNSLGRDTRALMDQLWAWEDREARTAWGPDHPGYNRKGPR